MVRAVIGHPLSGRPADFHSTNAVAWPYYSLMTEVDVMVRGAGARRPPPSPFPLVGQGFLVSVALVGVALARGRRARRVVVEVGHAELHAGLAELGLEVLLDAPLDRIGALLEELLHGVPGMRRV